MGKLDVMGTAEIGRRLGLSKSRVHQIVTSKGFPDPAATLTMGSIWQTSDVEAWIRKHRPPPSSKSTPG